MSKKKFLMPVSAAVAALFANASFAAIPSVEKQGSSVYLESTQRLGTEKLTTILERLIYQIGEQAHTLTLQKSSSEALYAGHGSHSSHQSHRSHRSHRSGR